MSFALQAESADLKSWQTRLRRKLVQRSGYDRMPRDKTPLNVRTLWKRPLGPGTVEKLVFTSEPGSDVVGYLCLPAAGERPPAVFICLQGHSTGMHLSIGVSAEDEVTPVSVQGDRDFAIGCMERGVAALCIEQRGFGQRREQVQEASLSSAPHLSCYEASGQALMLGRTLAAERVYDVDRAIDLLSERGDVDMKRLGLMGNSGGGLISVLSGAMLSRVKVMMPSCGFCTYRDSVMALPHCMDNYIPGLLLDAEMSDVLGLFAPRPVVVVTGQEDEYFPIKGVRKAFRELKAIYKAAGAEDHCHLIVGDGGHRFYAAQGWKQMLKHL